MTRIIFLRFWTAIHNIRPSEFSSVIRAAFNPNREQIIVDAEDMERPFPERVADANRSGIKCFF
jgi:hypothetical protein